MAVSGSRICTTEVETKRQREPGDAMSRTKKVYETRHRKIGGGATEKKSKRRLSKNRLERIGTARLRGMVYVVWGRRGAFLSLDD